VLAAGDRGIELAVRITPRPAARDGIWTVEPARPPTPAENPNEGFRLLSCTAAPDAEVTIEVTIRPHRPDAL